MNTWGKLAASSLALLALAGCSAAEPPAPTPTATVTVTATPTPTAEAASDYGPVITGDIEADVLAAGFIPDNMDSAVDWLDEQLCAASHEEVMGDTEFDRNVRMSGSEEDGDVGADALRVVVHYKCPQLGPALADSIADAEERFWG
ncbi:MAG TPA: hypothetical protein DCY59_09210 [Micrococcaceae bacterium]|nr:hypothetical protein [Micrococcaceae bacterium]